MSRIHPTQSKNIVSETNPIVWTVWNKSSMAFEGTDGFSIYDSQGRLTFRVDNYSRKHKCFTREVLLMDGEGKALVALRPKILSLRDRWNGYKIEEGPVKSSKAMNFSMRKRTIVSDDAEVFMFGTSDNLSAIPSYRIEGNFSRRCCIMRGINGEEVARICRKKVENSSVTLGEDVFTLIIQPHMECDLVMAFMIIMDRIFHKSCNRICS